MQRIMEKPPTVSSGEWQNKPGLIDYRSEWLSEVLVERVTWSEDAESHFMREMIADVQIAGPGYVWMRFWLKEEEQVLEKYFDAQGDVVGFYTPVCMPLVQENSTLSTQTLALALWYDVEGRLTILGEEEFDQAAKEKTLAPVEIEHAEHRIRELTLNVLNRTFPPGLVRNFSIKVEDDEETGEKAETEEQSKEE